MRKPLTSRLHRHESRVPCAHFKHGFKEGHVWTMWTIKPRFCSSSLWSMPSGFSSSSDNHARTAFNFSHFNVVESTITSPPDVLTTVPLQAPASKQGKRRFRAASWIPSPARIAETRCDALQHSPSVDPVVLMSSMQTWTSQAMEPSAPSL
jgi:hypothetical protein